MDILIKLLPWLLIAYGFWGGYETFDNRVLEVKNMEGEVSSLNAKLKKLKKVKKDIESYYSDRDVAKDNMEKISKDFEIAQKKLPEKQDDKENIRLFEEITKKVYIKNAKINMGNNKKKSGYIEKSYRVNGTGTYLQFLLFFEQLYKNEQLFDVSDILFRTVEIQEVGRFQVIDGQFDIKSYVYNASSDMKKGVDGSKK